MKSQLFENANKFFEKIKAVEYEKSDKMNQPVEKKSKAISNTEIVKETRRIKHEA